MEKINTKDRILRILLKQFSLNWTITSLAKEINLSRVGIWKVLKKLEKEKLIILNQISQGKTNTIIINLNWGNLVLERKLSLILAEETLHYPRWITNLNELENLTDFIVLYGSILHSPKEANDIDILAVVNNKRAFLKIEKAIQKIQRTQIKKIHSESFTKARFKEELKKPNKIFIDALKKGVVLFGQEKFIKFIRSMQE